MNHSHVMGFLVCLWLEVNLSSCCGNSSRFEKCHLYLLSVTALQHNNPLSGLVTSWFRFSEKEQEHGIKTAILTTQPQQWNSLYWTLWIVDFTTIQSPDNCEVHAEWLVNTTQWCPSRYGWNYWNSPHQTKGFILWNGITFSWNTRRHRQNCCLLAVGIIQQSSQFY